MIKEIYEKSPVFLQNFFCTIYGLLEGRKRYNSYFFKTFDSLIKTDLSSENEILEIKKTKLTNSLLLAKSTLMYQELNEIDDEYIIESPFTILEKLPVLTKDDVRIMEFEKLPNFSHFVSTSGTTGKSLKVPRCDKITSFQWAVWFRHRHRFGIKHKSLSVNFTGKPVVPLSYKGDVFWRYNAAQNQYLISMQLINDESIIHIVKFLNSIKPSFYSGYPSIIHQVADLALRHQLSLSNSSKPSVIFFGAEKLLDNQKDSLENWLGSEVSLSDQYGLTEACCNFSKCEYGRYHEDFEFSHVEVTDGIINDDGSITGSLVGTSLENNCFPLIRYFTGDIATIAPADYMCECGRKSQVIFDVDGRNDDFIITTDNRKIMRMDYLFKNTEEVSEVQLIQKELGKVIIKAVPSQYFEQSEFERKVIQSAREYIDDNLIFEFLYVQSIPRTSTGKFKAIINKVI